MTPDEIRSAFGLPTTEEIESFASVMRNSVGQASGGRLSRRDALACLHAAANIVIEIGTALGAEDPRQIVAGILLRECEQDPDAACRAVQEAQAKSDAGVAALRRKVPT